MAPCFRFCKHWYIKLWKLWGRKLESKHFFIFLQVTTFDFASLSRVSFNCFHHANDLPHSLVTINDTLFFRDLFELKNFLNSSQPVDEPSGYKLTPLNYGISIRIPSSQHLLSPPRVCLGCLSRSFLEYKSSLLPNGFPKSPSSNYE